MAKGSNNVKIVSGSQHIIDQWKYEIAAEMGLPISGWNVSGSEDTEFATELGSTPANSKQEPYWGHISSRDAGAVGGTITRRLIEQAQKTLFQL